MNLGYLKRIVFGTGPVPEGRVLVDPHAHFHRELDPNEVVNALFEKGVAAQAICDYGLKSGNPEHVIRYEEFVGRLNSSGGLEVLSSDSEMARVKRNCDNRRLLLFQGREMESEVKGSTGGFLYDKHMMHIVVHGMEPDYDFAEEILKNADSRHKYRTIAHPFTIPASKIEFWYANEEEKNNVVRLAREYAAALEGLNGTNSLWMTPTNVMVVETARRENLNLVYASDAHARNDIDLTREQVGTAGTTISKRLFNKAWEKKQLSTLLHETKFNGMVYGRVQGIGLFYRIMITPRLKKILKRE